MFKTTGFPSFVLLSNFNCVLVVFYHWLGTLL